MVEPLAWVKNAVFPDGEGSKLETYAIFPSVNRPRLLLPVAAPPAAAIGLRQHTNADRRPAKIAKEVTSRLIQSGVGIRILRHRLIVRSPSNDEDGGVYELMRTVFERRDVAFSVALGQLRPNAKPVLHVASAAGEPLGHAKLGWNTVTRPLVEHETHVLQGLASKLGSLRVLSVPPVLFAGDWHDQYLLVVGHLPSTPWTARQDRRFPFSAMRELWSLLPTATRPLGPSRYWRSLRHRATVAFATQPLLAQLLQEVLDSVDKRYTDLPLRFGLSHGDWAPWNMAARGGRLAVWDWERAVTDGPLGIDPLFFALQLRMWLRKASPFDAIHGVLADASTLLRPLEIEPETAQVLATLLIVEITLRQDEGQRGGARVPVRVANELPRLLRHLADQLQ